MFIICPIVKFYYEIIIFCVNVEKVVAFTQLWKSERMLVRFLLLPAEKPGQARFFPI